MPSLDDDKKKILMGATLGAAGAGALFLYLALRQKDKQSLSSDIIKAMENFASMLEQHNIEEPLPAIKQAEKTIEKNENTISDVLELVMKGIQLWKKIKK